MQNGRMRRIATLLKRIAPDKTYIGRVSNGFDFLGFHCCPTGMTVSEASLSRRDQKIARLYEQGASKKRIGAYLRRWLGWAGKKIGAIAVGIAMIGCAGALPPPEIMKNDGYVTDLPPCYDNVLFQLSGMWMNYQNVEWTGGEPRRTWGEGFMVTPGVIHVTWDQELRTEEQRVVGIKVRGGGSGLENKTMELTVEPGGTYFLCKRIKSYKSGK